MNNKIRQSVFSAILSVSLMGFIVSCGPSNPDNAKVPSDSEQSQTEQKQSEDAAKNAEETENQNSSSDKEVTSSKPRLVYYQMPGWAFCKQVTSIVDGLKNDYKDKLSFEIVPTTSERGQNEPEEYGLGRHGMVILSADGEKILWKKKGHQISKEEIKNGIKQSLNWQNTRKKILDPFL